MLFLLVSSEPRHIPTFNKLATQPFIDILPHYSRPKAEITMGKLGGNENYIHYNQCYNFCCSSTHTS